jgi:predicted nucleic acid-binding protein
MSARVFLDTNILVYLFDTDAPEKQLRARAVVKRYGRAEEAFISTQVLQEFYANVTRKLKISEKRAQAATQRLCRFPIVQVSAPMVLDAIAVAQRHRLSFWDSLIVQAAAAAGCSMLLTEDLQHGAKIGNLRIENPFLS